MKTPRFVVYSGKRPNLLRFDAGRLPVSRVESIPEIVERYLSGRAVERAGSLSVEPAEGSEGGIAGRS
jgi:hypothetical protein